MQETDGAGLYAEEGTAVSILCLPDSAETRGLGLPGSDGGGPPDRAGSGSAVTGISGAVGMGNVGVNTDNRVFQLGTFGAHGAARDSPRCDRVCPVRRPERGSID